jgi:hypothetical protein
MVDLAQRRDPGVQAGRDVQQPGRPLRDHGALRGQGGPTGGPVHQRHPSLRFHRTDPRRDRLLANPGLPGGTVQAAGPGHAQQHLQRGQVGNMSA